ncbi:MAG: hypothetical protein R3B82_04880 [Sandaracinaceae bacterium]
MLFSGLDREVILKVVDERKVRLLTEQLAGRRWSSDHRRGARWLADHGCDPAFGARPMGRTVEPT